MEGRSLWPLDLSAPSTGRIRDHAVRRAVAALEPGDFATLSCEASGFLAVAVLDVLRQGAGRGRPGRGKPLARGEALRASSHRSVRESLFLEGFGCVDLEVTALVPVCPQRAHVQGGAAVARGGEVVIELASGFGERLDFESRVHVAGRYRVECSSGCFETLKLRESVVLRGPVGERHADLPITVTSWKAPRVGVLSQEASVHGDCAAFELTAPDPGFVPESSRVLMLAYTLGAVRIARGSAGRRDLS